MQCKEWDDANSELFKESHDAAVQKNSYKGRLCELISASLKSGGNAKSQENPASTLLLSSGNAGSCCKGWYPCFCDGLSYILRICRIRFASPAPGEREEKIRSLYTGTLDFFLSKLHSGRNYRDIQDRWEIEIFHGKRPHYSLHTFILHKPLLFTTLFDMAASRVKVFKKILPFKICIFSLRMTRALNIKENLYKLL